MKEEKFYITGMISAESLGICESISGSMYLVAFGSPYATNIKF